MAEAKAIARNLRLSPRKARLVADLVRGKKVHEARDILTFTVKKASPIVSKLLESAVANAEFAAREKGQRIDTEEYVIDTIFVDGGLVMKRFQPASRGRPLKIRKRTSHITLVISGN